MVNSSCEVIMLEDDISVVKEILSGKTEYFDLLVTRYESQVYRYVYSMLNDRESSFDICQEVFITAYNKLYTYSLNYKFSNWIFKIAKNKTIDFIRKHKKIHQISIDRVQNVASNEACPEQCMQFDETKRLVHEFVNNLNDKDRNIVILKYSNESMTFNDIAQILNMTESGVKKRFYRLRDKFKYYISVMEEV